MSEKCKKCNKDTKRNIHYSIPAIWGRDKDGNLVKKLEGGIYCLDCWKKAEKNYRWYIDPTHPGAEAVSKSDGGEYYWDLKTNSWNDPDIPISPNDKMPNYWVGCFKCDWARELKDDERNKIVKCEKCPAFENDQIEIYPAGQKNNDNQNKCPKCNALIRSENSCWSCSQVKKLFENNGIKQAKLESDGSLSLGFWSSNLNKTVWNKISSSKLENEFKNSWELIKDYLQRTNKTTLTYENRELILGNSKNDNRERERERERANSTILCWKRHPLYHPPRW